MTAANDESEAKVYKVKSLLKSGLERDRASTIVVLIQSKDYFSSRSHLNAESFLIMFYKGLTICAKSKINLRRKLIFPRKDCIPFLVLGW